jgi:hypothetical protein
MHADPFLESPYFQQKSVIPVLLQQQQANGNRSLFQPPETNQLQQKAVLC